MCEHAAPKLLLVFRRRLPPVLHPPQPRRILKPDATPSPGAVLGGHILGDEYNAGRPPDQPVFPGFGLRSDQRKQGAAIRRSHGHPSLTGFQLCVEGQIEFELIQKESQALILISNINIDRMNPQVQALLIQ